MTDEYWHEHHELFSSTLTSQGPDPVTVWGRVHAQKERYNFTFHSREIIDVQPPRGTRVYVNMQPYLTNRNIISRWSLIPRLPPTASSAARSVPLSWIR